MIIINSSFTVAYRISLTNIIEVLTFSITVFNENMNLSLFI